MAKNIENMDMVCKQLIADIRKGEFSPLYLLMGDEPFYPDMVCQAILDNCIPEEDRDFNQTVLYGTESNAEQVISCARRYPMMSDRQLVVLKEAQLMKDVDKLLAYCENPLDSTVLVVAMHGGKLDKRGALYKCFAKQGKVVDSPQLRDYEVPGWISAYYRSRSLNISPDAAALLAEYAGTDLSKIADETDKLVKNLPAGSTSVSAADISRNVGISREFSIFELTKELNAHKATRALVIAERMSAAARFSMPAAMAMLFTNFQRILKYGVLLSRGPVSPEMKAKALQGVNPYFYREYEGAVRVFPPQKCRQVMSLLCEYDYYSKGGSPVTQDELFPELISKILNI